MDNIHAYFDKKKKKIIACSITNLRTFPSNRISIIPK